MVLATLDTVRVAENDKVVASHARTFDRARQVEDPSHLSALLAHKRQARAHRAQDRLHQAAPASEALFRAAAERGLHLGVLTRGLLLLLDTYGAEALQSAITAALEQDTPSLGAVRQLIDQQRHAKGLPPSLPVPLPDDPRIRNLQVRPHDLEDYDQLHREDDDEHDENS